MNRRTQKRRVLTTEAGAPVADNQNTATACVSGPLLIKDQHFFEKLARFNRERIPERVVHARGAGAHGYFEVTREMKEFTRADFLSEAGKRTEAFIRFSTVAGNLGSADAVRDPRGFSLRFYTEQGTTTCRPQDQCQNRISPAYSHVTSRKTKNFIAANASWLTVVPLPGYAPELNPVKQTWAWIKNGPLANYCATSLADLTDAAGRALDRLRKQPELLTPFLRHTGLARGRCLDVGNAT